MHTPMRDGKQAVSAERAVHMLEHMAYGGQRRLARTRVAQLRRHMREGTFLKHSHIDVCVATDTGEEWFVNGYHRLTAQVEEGLTIRYYVRVIAVESAAGVNAVYSIIDRIMDHRTTNNVINNRTDLRGDYPAKIRTAMFRSLQWIVRETENVPDVLDADIVKMWAEYTTTRDALGRELTRGLERMSSPMLRRMVGAAMMGIMLYTSQRDPEAATFWGDTVEMKPGWPNLLGNYLLSCTARGRRNEARERAITLRTYLYHRDGHTPTERARTHGLNAIGNKRTTVKLNTLVLPFRKPKSWSTASIRIATRGRAHYTAHAWYRAVGGPQRAPEAPSSQRTGALPFGCIAKARSGEGIGLGGDARRGAEDAA